MLVLDEAGWHRGCELIVPTNITLLELPPYAPELNPVENVWEYLRENWLAPEFGRITTPSWMPAAKRGTAADHAQTVTSISQRAGNGQ